MSRASLRALAVALSIGSIFAVGGGIDPHLDRGRLPDGCAACHRGHGESRSPMLPSTQVELCLSCHESQARREQTAVLTAFAMDSESTFLASTLANAYVHPMSDRAYSRHEPGVVTCTSCHSPHKGLQRPATGSGLVPVRKPSPRNPDRLEFELCGDCHGRTNQSARGLTNIGGRLGPNNASYHPVQAPAASTSPSVLPSLSGREINCTDCHGNSDPSGPRGPHGSAVRFILTSEYTTFDGSPESPTAYALCYGCHDRNVILSSSTFSAHRLHIVDERTSCTTCHDAHGSNRNRALIRFGEQNAPAGVTTSLQGGLMAFVSGGPGEGSCYLTCHGSDHAPKSYGGLQPASLHDGSGRIRLDRETDFEPQRIRPPG